MSKSVSQKVPSWTSQVSRIALLLGGLVGCGVASAQVVTSLSPGTASAGQSVAINIAANSSDATGPAALQWTMSYPSADVTGVSVTTGAAAGSAGKTVTCASAASETTCIVEGLDNTAIDNGTVAVATVQISPTPADSSIPLQLSGLVAADGDGGAISDTGNGTNIAVTPGLPQVGLLCSSTTLTTPGSLGCSVTLSAATSNAAGVNLTVSSNNSALSVPTSLVIPGGATSANFTVTAASVSSAETATLSVQGGSNSPSVAISLAPAPVQTPEPCTTQCSTEVAVDAGGSALGNFGADAWYSGGSTYSTGAAITTTGVTNPAPQEIYQTERFGNFRYTIPGLTAGSSYTVRLHFAELYWSQAGQRVFNVGINGAPMLTNFDIIAATGAQDIAIAKQFTATANASGQIVIQFTSVKDNAKVSGIEVLPATTATPQVTETAIDAGGTASGNFAADSWFNGGFTSSTSNVISTAKVTNPAPQEVYQSERYGNFTYTVPGLTAGASYAVRLHFAEIYWSKAGQRVFNVAINGTPVLSNFDIIAVAGAPDQAVVEQFTANANSSGQIVIQFTTVVDNAKISGIELIPNASQPAAPQTEVAVDAGGAAIGAFASDSWHNAGSTSSTGSAIVTTGVTNAAPQEVYQTERYGNFTYTIPGLTAGASYTVRLHFAEIYWSQAGQRVFNVAINGASSLSNFDIVAAAGAPDKAIVEQFPATANAKGQIAIQFTTLKDNAKISGIEVLAQ